jgi:aminoglycoside phosphotransferase (APT) family kinase protein
MTTSDIPDAALAGALAAAATGYPAAAVSRFTTGSQHYVFDVNFADRASVVVRLSLPRDRALAAGSIALSRQLRPLGVPLPAILAANLDSTFPYVVFERLPGTDLGQVAAKLPKSRLEGIAAKVAEAQRIVATTPSAGRYGYAADPASAPCVRWSQILDNSLNKSRGRIASTGLFDLQLVDDVEAVLAAMRDEVDAQPAVPYLHDTTTKNVIVAPDGTFSGIVDVDDLCFGDPRSVIALTLAALAAFGGPLSYAENWLALTGFKDDRLFRLYVVLCLLDFLSEQGQVFNGNELTSSEEEQQRLLGIFNEAFRRLTG